MDRKEVVGFIPSLLFKLFLYLKDKFDPKQPIPEEEKITFQICQKLIQDPKSKLTIAPISNKRFIKNEEKNIFVVFETNTINLVNHIYSHSVYVSDVETFQDLKDSFDKYLDKERLKLEDEIKNNIKNTLQEILKKFN
jgi:hypothetical protein